MNFIKTHKEGGLFYLILNRPDKRNALNSEFVAELTAALHDANDDDKVRVVIIQAVGNTFSAGADLAYLQQLQQNTYEENLEDSSQLMRLFELMYYHKKILIAQVEGHAIAGGCGLATACDFVFSVPEAKFGYTEVKIGFVPAIVMIFLLRKIGEANARNLLLTGHLISADEAQAINMVTEVIPAEAISTRVQSFATELAGQTSPISIAITRRMIADIQSMQAKDALRYAATQNAMARSSHDCQRGIASFLNKEDLRWG